MASMSSKYEGGKCSIKATATDTSKMTSAYNISSSVVGTMNNKDSVTIVCMSASPFRCRIKKGSTYGWVPTASLKNSKGVSISTLAKKASNTYSCSAAWQVAAYVAEGYIPTQEEVNRSAAAIAASSYGASVSLSCTLSSNSYLYTAATGDNKIMSTSIKKGNTVTLIAVNLGMTKSGRARVKTVDGKIGWINIQNIKGTSSDKALWTLLSNAKSGASTDSKMAANLIKKNADDVVETGNSKVVVYNTDLNSSGSGLYTKEQSIDATTLMKDNLSSIFAIPYQFHPIIDQRTIENNNAFGRKYGEKIVANMPLLLLTPGRPTFMPHYSSTDTNIAFKALINGKADNILSEVLYQPGKYYSFKYAYSGYYEFVDPMLHTCAKFLGIDDVKLNISGYSAKLGNFHWINIINNKFKNFVGSKKFIGFYLDSPTQISESISTSTTESQIASSVNNISDMAKEVQFLLGSFAGKELAIQDTTEYQKGLDKINSTIDSNAILKKGGKLFKSLGEAFSTVAAGGKMYFPEIWSDTTYTKSHDINIKLRTPDTDPLSWYINICVPLIHLLCLAAPQTMGPNGYASPFLVKGCYKGLYNWDMGIITDLDISKGKEGAWTLNGLPTEVDVNMTIKDLYSVLSIINNESPKAFLKNTAMVDYLANTCSLNINKEEIQRTIDLYLMLYTDKVKSAPNRVYTKFSEDLQNLALSNYEKWAR